MVDSYEVLNGTGKTQYFIDGLEVPNFEEIEATHDDRKRLVVLKVMLESVV